MNPDQLRDELSANATQTTILRDQHQTLSNVSQDPVQRASPVGLTPKQEIRLLWPVKVAHSPATNYIPAVCLEVTTPSKKDTA